MPIAIELFRASAFDHIRSSEWGLETSTTMPRNLLVPIDGSEQATGVLEMIEEFRTWRGNSIPLEGESLQVVKDVL